jgi:hypothetical protein
MHQHQHQHIKVNSYFWLFQEVLYPLRYSVDETWDAACRIVLSMQYPGDIPVLN